MTIPKVFAVFSDNLSASMPDELLHIYSSEEDAKEAVSLYNRKTYYTEWEINKLPEHPKGHKAFSVSIEDLIIRVTPFDILSLPNLFHLWPSIDKSPSGRIAVWCWATDEDHAKKVAIQMIKDNEQQQSH